MQVLRDLCALQVQSRDYSGYIETRNQLLKLKSSQKANWLGLAVAYHLGTR